MAMPACARAQPRTGERAARSWAAAPALLHCRVVGSNRHMRMRAASIVGKPTTESHMMCTWDPRDVGPFANRLCLRCGRWRAGSPASRVLAGAAGWRTPRSHMMVLAVTCGNRSNHFSAGNPVGRWRPRLALRPGPPPLGLGAGRSARWPLGLAWRGASAVGGDAAMQIQMAHGRDSPSALALHFSDSTTSPPRNHVLHFSDSDAVSRLRSPIRRRSGTAADPARCRPGDWRCRVGCARPPETCGPARPGRRGAARGGAIRRIQIVRCPQTAPSIAARITRGVISHQTVTRDQRRSALQKQIASHRVRGPSSVPSAVRVIA